jgi:hypothetical protein
VTMDMPEEPEPLRREDYPHITYWHKHERQKERKRRKSQKESEQQSSNALRGPGRAAAGENVSFWFLQNIDGTEIDGHTLTELRARCKDTWATMAKKHGDLGLPWGHVSPTHKLEFWLRVEAKFPLLRFCSNHYKANAIATSDYTHWYKLHVKHGKGKAKSKDKDKAKPSTGKRSRSTKAAHTRRVQRRDSRSCRVRQMVFEETQDEEEDMSDDKSDDDEDDNEDGDEDDKNDDNVVMTVESLAGEEQEVIIISDDEDEDPDVGRTSPRPPRQSPRRPARVPAASSSNNNCGAPSSTVCIHTKSMPPSCPTAGAGLETSNGGTQNKSNAPHVKPRPIGTSHPVSMSIRNRTAAPMVRLTVASYTNYPRYQDPP